MWERNLKDLIRGLRAHKKDESKFIAKAMDEIRQEIKTKDMELKAAAVLKLTYLEMMGYDMGWASFYVVEVMSSPRFHLKSMGYLAAAQSFEQDTDVLMLTTNLLKKDLLSSTPADVAVALNGLSQIVTPDLGRDLTPNLMSILNHSRAQIRKRAVLALYKVFLKYPEALALGIERLREKLEDPDSGVVSATVNVLCELTRQNPREYLPLAPQLFHILTTSSNNWMLIKTIKLFGVLCPHEPRLVKKLLPPITDLISTTPAVSLLYECVHTCIIGGMLQGASGYSLAKTCVTKLAAFLEDADQNLKYIALLALVKIVPSHPHLVAEYESRILSSIDDPDLTIRMRTLDLISAMATPNNLQSIVGQLLSHLVRPDSTPSAVEALVSASTATAPGLTIMSPTQSESYRAKLSSCILEISSAEVYENVTDFEWYLSVLIDLAYVAQAPVGPLIRDQLVDVCVRVKQVRKYAVQLCVTLLGDETFVGDVGGFNDGNANGAQCEEVLWAAAWICGEYCAELSDPRPVLSHLLKPAVACLAPETIAVYLQSATKIFSSWAAELSQRWDEDYMPEVKELVETIASGVSQFTKNEDIEVQERAANILQLFTFIRADVAAHQPRTKVDLGNGFANPTTSEFDPLPTSEPHFPKSLYLLQPLCSAYPLNPVAPTAQASVPVPDGLDLDAWIIPAAKHDALGDHETVGKLKKKGKGDKNGKGKMREAEPGSSAKNGKKKKVREEIAEAPEKDRREVEAQLARLKAERLERMRDDPYYIVDDRPNIHAKHIDIESIPVVRLDDLPPLPSGGPSPKIPTPADTSRPRTPQKTFVIDRGGEMPANAVVPPQPASSSKVSSRVPTPSLGKSALSPPTMFPQYEVADEVPRTSTQEPIKVTRAKKKTTSGKKKRTANLGVTDG